MTTRKEIRVYFPDICCPSCRCQSFICIHELYYGNTKFKCKDCGEVIYNCDFAKVETKTSKDL